MTRNPPIIPKSHLASDFHFFHTSPNKNKVQNKITKEMDIRSQGWSDVFTFSVFCTSLTNGRGVVQGERRQAPFEPVLISSQLGVSNRWCILDTCYFLNLFYFFS